MLMLGINEGFDASVVLSRDGTILCRAGRTIDPGKGDNRFPIPRGPSLHQTI